MADDHEDRIKRAVADLSPDQLAEVIQLFGAGRTVDPLAPPVPEPITLPDPPSQPSLLTLRVDVDGASPPVWRRLALRGDLTLSDVHTVLQTAFGWEDMHLHRFWPGPDKRIWTGPFFRTDDEEDEHEGGPLESDVRLDQLLRARGDRLFYTYDFGDEWTHTIRVESVEALVEPAPPARCLLARRAGPLEDVGGVGAHNELVAQLRRDPSRRTLPDEQRDWIPPGWDPTDASAEEVNGQLMLIGRDGEELLELFGAPPAAAAPPPALEPLLDRATGDVVREVAGLCALAETRPPLSPEEVAVVVRPYRLLVELARDDGIPLTATGWMRPSFVQHLYFSLELEDRWPGQGDREDQTPPVAALRSDAQRVGLLRRRQGRLVRTPLALRLGSDEDYLEVLVDRLLAFPDPLVQSANALWALHVAAHGEVDPADAGDIASMLNRCRVRHAPGRAITGDQVLALVRPSWAVLDLAARGPTGGEAGDRRAAGLARMALFGAHEPG